MDSIGFIGLGNLGQPMARHLQSAGWDLTVYDIRDEAIAPLVAEGAQGASTPAEVGAQSDVVFTCLVDPDQVLEVLTGPDGALTELPTGATVIDTTTGLPRATRELAALLDVHDVNLLGAPVSGNQDAGELTTIVGGPGHVLAKHEEKLEPFSKNVFHVGENPSDGIKVKLMNNYLVYCNLYAACEAVVAGSKAGIDEETLLEVINHSAGSSTATRYIIPEHVLTEKYDLQANIGISKKDLQLAVQFFEDNKTPAPLAGDVRHLFRYATADLGGDSDLSHLFDHVESLME